MSTEPVDFIVQRKDLSAVRWEPAQTRADRPLAEGDVLLRVDRFALTANNITYGVVGDLARYWEFFPARSGWGRLPVWGFADVVESRTSGLAPGDRVYGYLPISTFVLVRPEGVTAQGFVDATEHRRSLPLVYQQYARAERSDPTKEGVRALLAPLFGTGFLIDDWLKDEAQFGARQIVIASASSKTALAAAFQLSRRPGRDYEVIGLTSPRNRAFCEQVGFYDRVVEYGGVDSLSAAVPTVLVDMAANFDVLRAVHGHFGAALRHSCMVGMTHQPASLAVPPELPGPAPVLFFAPTHIEQRQKAWGADVLRSRVTDAQRAFLAAAAAWLEIVPATGQIAIEAAYRKVLTGHAQPNQGLILSL